MSKTAELFLNSVQNEYILKFMAVLEIESIQFVMNSDGNDLTT